MIISKDLFIFGEHIFATIIPEGGTTATQGSQQQQEQQHHHQQQQQQFQLTATPQAAIINAIATTATGGGGGGGVELADRLTSNSSAGGATVVSLIKQETVANTVTPTPTLTATATPTTTTSVRKAKEPRAVKEVEEAKHKRKEKQQHKANVGEFNGGAKLFPTTTTITPPPTPKPTPTPIPIIPDEPRKHLEATTKANADIRGASAVPPQLLDTLQSVEEAEKEPLVAKQRNSTRILSAKSIAAPIAEIATKDIDIVVSGRDATFTNFIARDQQDQRTPTGDALTPAPAPAPAPASIMEPPPIVPLPVRIIDSQDLSLNMNKVMLTNEASNNHTAVTFPFIPEPNRTIQLTFQNITVFHKERKILSDISGMVSPGEVLAIMGPSGCGKTTLLDCLSGQRHLDGGSIYLNREPISKKWRRKICYVLQEEIFFSGLTLKETVMYTALLRLPEKMPKEEKMNLVDRILETLELNFCQQTKFGDYLNRGLSGGEKKRANIACELLTNPLLMLLDEPTSGLDSHSAISLMKVLKRYAMQEQKTVVITVHQPSSQMFHMFDKLLLLYNGRTAYFGEVKNIYRYFEDIGVAIKPHYNPADFVLEQLKSYPDIREKLFVAARESHGNFLNRNCITVHNHHGDGGQQQHNHHRPHQHHQNHHAHQPHHTSHNNGITVTSANGSTPGTFVLPNSGKDKSNNHDSLINDIISNYYKDIQGNHHHITHDAMLMVGSHHDSCEEASQHLWCGADSHSNFSSASSDCHHNHYESSNDWLDYPTRFHTQFRVLSSRNFKEAKPRMLSKLNWFQTIGLALMAGAIWFQIPRTEEFLHDLQGWMFFSQTYWMLFALFGALNSFPSEREVISKERRSGAYRLSAYYMAKMCGELPLVITLPTVYLIISYPMLGCSSVKLFCLMLVFLLLNTIVAQSVGFFIGACCMDMNVSITLSALYTLATQLFGGYLSSRIPEGLSWIRYTSMIHYAYQNMQILEFREGPAIRCGNPSSYEICKSSSTDFIPYEEILKAQNSTSPLWLNTLILMMFFLVFRGLGYAVLRYVRCPKT